MNESILSFKNVDPEALPLASASRLLRLGLTEQDRPVDELIRRLEEPDGAAWLPRTLAAHAGLGDRAQIETFIAPGADLNRLHQLKESGKKSLARHASGDARLAAIALYFLSVAAALRHHQSLICSRPRDEVTAVLLDLAAATAEPWSTMLSEAAIVRA